MDKVRVVEALRQALAQELAGVEAAAALARDEVQSDETRQEGQYDTRATEASYLARGQAERIADLRALAAWFEVYDPQARLEEPVVQVGALVTLVEDGGAERVFFVAPQGGLATEVDGRRVTVISPSSPLGVAMEELEEGDGFEVDSPRGIVEYEVRALA